MTTQFETDGTPYKASVGSRDQQVLWLRHGDKCRSALEELFWCGEVGWCELWIGGASSSSILPSVQSYLGT